MTPRLLSPFLVLVLWAAPAAGDLITGRVVDPSGAGVPGVNLDAIDLINGGQASLTNDSTDAGGFFTTTIAAGVYRVIFKPPPPPATTLLVLEVDPVVVSGTVSLGTRTLALGVSLGGRTLQTNGIPAANVDVDVVDVGTGQEVPLQGDNTNAFGTFNISVPSTPIEVQFKTDNVLPTLAPIALQLDLNGNASLGDVTLEPGFFLEGTVERTSGQAVVGADLDVRDGASGVQLFTPGDNTDSGGDFSVVVAAGTYDVEICPNPANGLVATEIVMLSIVGDTDVGTIVLQNGVTLSGTITDGQGAPVQNADVDVRFSASGVAVVLCSDNSNASGAYSVIVPTGTFDVTFSPPGSSCLGSDVHLGVVVSGNTVRNGVLPNVPDLVPPIIACPPHVAVGAPKAGPYSTVVTFNVTASDNCDAAPSIVCVPPSGSVFQWGATTVNCTATDASGNSAVCSFKVYVQPFLPRRR
jgi:hypothetical protein